MKLSRLEATSIIPVTKKTIKQMSEADPKFPAGEKFGSSEIYYDKKRFLKWLESRSSKKIKLKDDDTVLTSLNVCDLLNRSPSWLFKHVIKTGKFAIFNLSPSGEKSDVSRNYFLEREIVSEFSGIIELNKQNAA